MKPTDPKTIRLLLVEDHHVTRLGLRTLLSGCRQFEIVGEAGTVSDAITEAERLKPDVMLLDVRLPDGNGLDVCRHLHRSGQDTKVLVLTSYADDQLVFDALAAGADGYLLKEIDGPGLLDAIENVATGRSVLDPAVTRRVILRVRSQEGAPAPSQLDQLSPQERRVVALVAEGKTNKEIGAELGLSDKTVKNYLSNALEKLHLSRRTQAAALFVSHARRHNPTLP